MKGLGTLSHGDPLYRWLIDCIYPKIGLTTHNAAINVYPIEASHDIYVYEVWQNGRVFRVVGKFYGNEAHAEEHFRTEIDHFSDFKRMGLTRGSHRVPRLLGYHRYINFVVVTEHVSGERLDRTIAATINGGDDSRLYGAFAEVAYFLHLLHSRSMGDSKVNFRIERSYFSDTLKRLKRTTHLSEGEEAYFHRLADRWAGKPEMWGANSVFVHGDCTPSNFVLSHHPRLVALDLERCRRADPAFDTGRIAGELKHSFMLLAGDGRRAEPFIRHFYKAYCSHFNSPNLFGEITGRNPFYQSVTELRIAKNPWLPLEHRYRLIHEAKKCLEAH